MIRGDFELPRKMSSPGPQAQELLSLVDSLRPQIKKLNVYEWNSSMVDLLEKKMNDVVQDLRCFRNNLLPVNSLPQEILFHIFRFVALDPATTFYSGHELGVLSLVCHGWRSTVLSDVELWSHIRVHRHTSPQYLDLQLARSKGAHLRVDVDNAWGLQKPESIDRLLSSVFGQTRRLKHLSILFNLQSDGSVFPLSHLNAPAPALESLEISYHDGEEVYTLPPMFSDHVPRLRHLLLDGVRPWPSISCHALTSFKLLEQHDIDRGALLDLLDAASQLTHITFDHCDIHDDGSSPSRHSELLHLSHVEFTNCHSSSLLSLLRVPSFTSINIKNTWAYRSIYTDHEGGCDLVDSIPRDCGNLKNLQHITAAKIFKGADDSVLTMEGLGATIRIAEMHGCTPNPPEPLRVWELCLRAMSQHPIFSNLETLRLEWLPDAREWTHVPVLLPETYREIFAELPQVKDISLKMASMTNTIVALGVPPGQCECECIPVLPKLRSLSVDVVNFGRDWLDVLEKVVKWRHKKGVPLWILSVREICGDTGTRILGFQEHVSDRIRVVRMLESMQ